MKTTADLNARIEELEEKLDRAYAEINSQSEEIVDYEATVTDLDNQIFELVEQVFDLSAELDNKSERSIYEFVADAIHRRDVLGLDDGDVLSIIHQKLQRAY